MDEKPKTVKAKPKAVKVKMTQAEKDLHKYHRERMRKKFMEHGLEAFEDHEALEMLLYYCIPLRNTNDMAHRIINEFGSIDNLFEAHPLEIKNRCKLSEPTAVLIALIAPFAKRYTNRKWSPRVKLDSSRTAGEYATSLYMGETKECFYLICLDVQRQLIFAELLNRGTIAEAAIYPREVVRTALKHNAAKVILSHNHPSGHLAASASDIDATKKIMNALSPIEVEVVDHIIVGGNHYFSFSEKKLLGLEY